MGAQCAPLQGGVVRPVTSHQRRHRAFGPAWWGRTRGGSIGRANRQHCPLSLLVSRCKVCVSFSAKMRTLRTIFISLHAWGKKLNVSFARVLRDGLRMMPMRGLSACASGRAAPSLHPHTPASKGRIQKNGGGGVHPPPGGGWGRHGEGR